MRKSNVVCIWQGLGNQMFQYAFAKSLEIHTGRRVYIDGESLRKDPIGDLFGSNTIRDYGLNHFKISLKQVSGLKRFMWSYTRGDRWYHEIIKFLIECNRYPYKYFDQKNYADISLYMPSLDEIESSTYIKGWFQSEEYFLDIRHILLKEFEPKKEIEFPYDIEKKIKNTESVSVHIRRGDYKKNNLLLDENYYKIAMKRISEEVNSPVWVVFSDDIEYVKKNYEFEGETILVDETYKLKDYEQLILMSKCKHNIIANSTFSWWGAWLNQNKDKRIIAPTKWFCNQRNIVPESWIKI